MRLIESNTAASPIDRRETSDYGEARAERIGRGIARVKRFLLRLNVAVSTVLVSATAILAMIILAPDSRADAPTYSIDFQTISAGGTTLRGSCYRLSATVAQVAPGYSSGTIYSIFAGYWQPSDSSATDEIFFNGFEVC